MSKSKWTTVEMQNPSEQLISRLDKTAKRNPNLEGMVEDISKTERKRKDQNKENI